MELVFSRSDMAQAMKMASRAAGRSSGLPVLSNVLISAHDPLWSMWDSSQNNGNSIYLAATDLEIGVRMKIPGRVTQPGAITLPVKTFTSFMDALSADDVKLVSTNGRAKIHSEKGKFSITGASADQFPSLIGEVSQNAQLELTEQSKDEKETHFLSLAPDVLKWMVRKVSFAASRDDGRHYLNGVHFSLSSLEDKTLLRMAATDGTRLAVASMIIEEALDKEVEAIIPYKAVKELEKLDVSADAVKIALQDNRMVFDAGDTALVTTLVEGEYPDYQQIIREKSVINLKADTGELITVIRRISQVSNPKLPCVKLEIAGNRMKVSADSPYVGDGSEEMDVEKAGDDVGIAVNVRYLMDALRAIDTQETLVDIDSELKPIVIRPSPGSDQGQASGEHLCILMPVRLSAG
ncbi:DNA polymerase III subunit beta [Candidatus Poribacteria bacterium]